MTATIELLWIPLGAGQHVVRISGRIFERLAALVQHRRPSPLYHSALVVSVDGAIHVIEMTPVADAHGERRGVVAEGAVGSALLSRFRLFRYEIHCWAGGTIPDADQAARSVVLRVDDADARQLLDAVADVPTPVWGRDELDAGEMWNSNSVTAWVLAQVGIETTRLAPPDGGRAPGWNAGTIVAGRGAPLIS